jgi:hypothetical protein
MAYDASIATRLTNLRDRLSQLTSQGQPDAAVASSLVGLLQEARGLYNQVDPHTTQGYELQLFIEDLVQRLFS